MKDTLSYQVYHLLKKSNISIDFTELTFQIKSHPTHPSLHSITGVLDHFNIQNLALDVPRTIETLNQLPKIFLAQLEINYEKQFVVVEQTIGGYKLIFDSKNKKTISESELLNQFTGILLVVDPNETHINPTNSQNKSIYKIGLTVASIITLSLLLMVLNPEIEILLYIILSVLGMYASTSILKQEFGENSLLGDAFCSKSTENNNCNAVLTSKGSIISKGFKLSDLSFIYFTSLGLATFVLVINNSTIFILKLISIIAIPITFYSIYYQSLVIKKWCTLCLSIVGIMWLHMAISVANFSPNYNLNSILITMLSFMSISLFWIFESKIRRDNKTLKQIKVEYFKFKRHFELFNDQLSKSKLIDTKINNTKEIVFGNTNSQLEIIFVTNPTCGPCKQVHNVLEEILKKQNTLVKLTVRFNVRTEKRDSMAVVITSRLLEIYDNDGITICIKAMHDIYNYYTPSQWLNKWGKCSKPNYYLKILQNQNDWCNSKVINFTPEILINGQSFPKLYNRSDLIYFIEDLVEISEIKKQNILINKTEDV